MKITAPRYGSTVVSLAISVFLVGFVFLGVGCPPVTPMPECTADADCDDGLFCNGAETCVAEACVAGTDPCDGGECDEENDQCVAAGCTSDADCADGEFCDLVSGECATNENLYEEAAFDHDLHRTTMSIACDSCHHDGAGFVTCDTCHDRDEVVGGIVVLKDAMHNADSGCRACHDDETADGLWDCSKCHTGLSD